MRYFKKFEDTHTHKLPGIEYSGVEVSVRDDGGDVHIFTTDIDGNTGGTMITPEQAVELGVWLIYHGSRLIEEAKLDSAH